MLRINLINNVKLRFKRLTIFQRVGRPKTEIHRCTIATKPKKNAQRERNALNLSNRIAHLYVCQTQASEIFIVHTAEVEKQEKIGGAKFRIPSRRSTDQRA